MSKKPQYDPEEIRFPDQKIETSYLVHEMEQSYIEYAMSVIVGRARLFLPSRSSFQRK